jgi:hypothetical protein
VDKIRVLLANHPIMVPDVIRDLLAQQEDMELVGDCRGPMTILQETGRVNADAVILAQEGAQEPALCSQLLSVYPDLMVMSIGLRTKTVYMQRLCPLRQTEYCADYTDVPRILRAQRPDIE